jgi:siroheme synthase-like protein
MSFPVALDLRARRCLVVGFGGEATLRVANLRAAGAEVVWVTRGHAASPLPGFDTEVRERQFQSSDLSGCWLVVLTDTDAELAQQIGIACEERRIYFCAIDQPAFNSFSHVAVVRRGPVEIAISTGGRVPALARRLKVAFEGLFGADFTEFAERLAHLRASTPPRQRREVLDRVLSGFALQGSVELPPGDGADGKEPR